MCVCVSLCFSVSLLSLLPLCPVCLFDSLLPAGVLSFVSSLSGVRAIVHLVSCVCEYSIHYLAKLGKWKWRRRNKKKKKEEREERKGQQWQSHQENRSNGASDSLRIT